MVAKQIVVPVVLCGGAGARLWPLSRAGFPKQFLNLTGNVSLFQQACSRLRSLEAQDIEIANPLVVTNDDHRFLALEQLRELTLNAQLMLEPVGRNTAPALMLAALQASTENAEPVLFVKIGRAHV